MIIGPEQAKAIPFLFTCSSNIPEPNSESFDAQWVHLYWNKAEPLEARQGNCNHFAYYSRYCFQWQDTNRQSGGLLDFSPHRTQEVFTFSERCDVGPCLLELMRVVLQDVPVSLKRVEQCSARRTVWDVLCVLNHAIVHLCQLKTKSDR